MDSDKTPQQKNTLLGILAMSCREAFLDQRGRLLITHDVRKRLSSAPGDEEVLVGRGTHFGIWNKDNEASQRIESDFPENDELGIL